MIVLEDYEREHAFGESEVRLLSTVAASMGVALENARLFDETQRLLKETEQRAAELAIINSVQEGLAAQLDFQAIIDLVGDKIAEIFNTRDMAMALHDGDQPGHHAVLPGARRALSGRAVPLGVGFTGDVIRTREPLVINENFQAPRRSWARRRSATWPLPMTGKSYLGVPILKGEEAFGVIAMYGTARERVRRVGRAPAADARQQHERRARERAPVRRDAAAAQGDRAARRRARHHQQRASRRSPPSSTSRASTTRSATRSARSSSSADMGDPHLRSGRPNIVHFPYAYEDGKRITVASRPLLGPAASSAHVLRTGETLVRQREPVRRAMAKLRQLHAPGHASPRNRWSGCRWSSGDQARGLIDLVDIEREHAFGDSDVRLLQTLANSMSVALENARLFDETQRLFKESEQRAAELAIINSVQEALAAELNMQGIYDAVGDKIREIFQPADVGIRIYDPPTRPDSLPLYCTRTGSGSRSALGAAGGTRIRSATCFAHARRWSSTRTWRRQMAQYGSFTLPGTPGPRSRSVLVPLVAGDQARGIISLMDLEREHAFSDIGRAPAADARQQHERGARECASLRRDAAPVQGERAARGRARDHQQRAAGARCRAQHAGHLRRRRRQDPRDLQPGRRRHPHLRSADGHWFTTRTSTRTGKRSTIESATSRRHGLRRPTCCARARRW